MKCLVSLLKARFLPELCDPTTPPLALMTGRNASMLARAPRVNFRSVSGVEQMLHRGFPGWLLVLTVLTRRNANPYLTHILLSCAEEQTLINEEVSFLLSLPRV